MRICVNLLNLRAFFYRKGRKELRKGRKEIRRLDDEVIELQTLNFKL